jgi:hypothetical protein
MTVSSFVPGSSIVGVAPPSDPDSEIPGDGAFAKCFVNEVYEITKN